MKQVSEVRGQKSEVKEWLKVQGSRFREVLITGNQQPATAFLKFMPLWIEAIGMGVFMGAILDSNPTFKERLKELGDKVFLFTASDIKKNFYFHIKDGDIKVIPNFAGNVDVTMQGETNVLFGLLLGKEDPDTVFFSRKLIINGDTASAIHFKNILNNL
ncbi:MAG: hypothetical protein A2073_07760 [Deltaproteobacteria bacterium GWC2_42_11]|nr:MAG: hypothetical protein A2073_07760 [Deltaproteobacteria bacterium GWC2_42_11]HBO84404.1 hypothetical protein [Deltaproteobacteria bacterium]